MVVPFDPHELDPEEYGEKRATLATGHESAIDRVREGPVPDAGFGVPVEFSPSELLNEKVAADRDPYYVLGACNPESGGPRARRDRRADRRAVPV